MKKMLIVFLAVMMSIGCVVSLPVSSASTGAEDSGVYEYTVENGNATIAKYRGKGSNIAIPSMLGGCPVVSIGKQAFSWRENLTSVVIPDGIVSIGYGAFGNCTGLTSVNIPNSVTSIDDRAFEWCENLTSISIPNSVVRIGATAFSRCIRLTSITIPCSITSIRAFQFAYCTGLTSITIPDSVLYIEYSAFENCTNLTTVIFNGANTKFVEVESYLEGGHGGIIYYKPTFEGCTKLTTFYGYPGSQAETYAIENGVSFIPLDDINGETNGGISVFFNGTELVSDQPPIIENDRTLIPFRAIFEALGAEVSWDEATQTVTGKLNETTIKLTIGNETAYVNEKPIPLDVPPKLLNDRTLVPLRFVTENFGFKVDWDEEKQRVDIIK